ncbi:MAG: hypothetical protein ACI8Y7_000584 [Candidatus Woesearchaeota archaeon]|jgi:hypothetical protein
MPNIEVVSSLVKEILKKFSKTEAHVILDLLESLEQSPTKGKLIGHVGGISIKELKYKKFRFYCIFDGATLRAMNEQELVDLLFRFVRMSDKKRQQKVINSIKEVLLKIGPSGFK